MARLTDPDDVRDAMFAHACAVNIAFLLRFNQKVETLLRSDVARLDAKLEFDADESGDLRQERGLSQGAFTQYLTNGTFLLLYASAEEWFELVRRTYAKETRKNDRGTLTAFREILRHELSYDPETSEGWRVIVDCEKLRNCLIHANGRADLSSNPAEVRSLLRRRSRHLGESNKRIVVQPELLPLFAVAIREIVDRVQGLSKRRRPEGESP
jgi:hypothetical protein